MKQVVEREHIYASGTNDPDDLKIVAERMCKGFRGKLYDSG